MSATYALEMLERNRRVMEQASGGSVLKMLERNRRVMEQASGGSVLKMLERNRSVMEQMTGGSVLKMLERNRSVMEQMTGGSVLKMLERNRSVMEQMTGGSVLRSMEESRRLLRGMSQNPRFASMVGVDKTLVQMTENPAFASMIDSVRFPRREWESIFDRLSEQIGPEARDAAMVGVEVAVRGGEESSTGLVLPWFWRQPLGVQLVLAHAALEALFKASEFVMQVTLDEDLPADFRTATEMLFRISMFLIVYIQAQQKG